MKSNRTHDDQSYVLIHFHARCDIMFLSHNHPDHIDPVVVKMFTDMGKQVIAPNKTCVQIINNGVSLEIKISETYFYG